MVHSGGAQAFSGKLVKFVKNRRSALLTTWVLGLAVFIDDYLNALTVGPPMKGLTDKHKVSRPMPAYIVDTTAAPNCVLIPQSTWASPRRWRSPSFSSVFQKVLSFGHMFDDAMEGVKGMLPAAAIIIVAFMLKDVNDTLKLTDFLIGTVSPWMTAVLLPMICFGALALIAFATGSFRGMYAIALPIVLPLGEQVGVDPALTISAVVSAGAFGAGACFYGDSTVLPATATDVEPTDHAITQLPYILIAAAVAWWALPSFDGYRLKAGLLRGSGRAIKAHSAGGAFLRSARGCVNFF